MAEFSIKLFEFALLVHRPGGLTALFPAADHGLMLTKNTEKPKPVKSPSLIVLCDSNGVPVSEGATTVKNPEEYVFDLRMALDDSTVEVDATVLTRTTVDARLNARVDLSGGALTELPCEFSPGLEWTFANGVTRKVTDSAVFTHTIEQGETFYLSVDNTLVSINAGDTFVLENADELGGSNGDFVELAEFSALCGFTNARSVAFPRNVLRPTRRFDRLGPSRVMRSAVAMFGTDAVCAMGGISSSV